MTASQASAAHSPNLLTPLVQTILQQQAGNLPDLSHIDVILPNSFACHTFRRTLLELLPADVTAVIPPWCGDISSWLHNRVPHIDDTLTTLSSQDRKLLFIEALSQHPQLFKQENQWQVSDALLQLFDQLGLHQSNIPDSLQQWTEQIAKAYQAEQSTQHLSYEARLVHTLWQAWQQQLSANQQVDETQATLLRLSQVQQSLAATQHCYFVKQNFFPAEQICIEQLINNKQATIIDCYQQAWQNTTGQFVHACYDTSTPLSERSKNVNANAAINIEAFITGDDETEVAAIDIKIRQWILQGKTNIGVICEDRRVARRLRALLERSNIALQDHAGWSLATTSAASVIERWLECIEENFDQRALLDLLKSNFINSNTFSHIDGEETFLQNVYRFERDIVKHENVYSDLDRYLQALLDREKRLHGVFNWLPENHQQLQYVLEKLKSISTPLSHLHTHSRLLAASVFLDTLNISLDKLGVRQRLAEDTAGQKVLQCMQQMHAATKTADPLMHWHDFRIWLGTSLEGMLFQPNPGHSIVKLMTLEQSACQTFQALVIAAANRNTYPGSPQNMPFFNQSVRTALGLPGWQHQLGIKQQQFKQALLSADNIYITCKDQNNGEALPLSPWIESLLHFYHLVYKKSMRDTDMPALLKSIAHTKLKKPGSINKQTEHYQPVATASDLPARISAGSHQRLINCPYQFFTADILQLRTAEEISRELQKADYGELVHRALQVFHTRISGMPAPFNEKIHAGNRDAAIQHLSAVSETLFQSEVQKNILHKSWLNRWQQHIPAYIDWQIKHNQTWDIARCEATMETEINEDISLFGRLDRIDKNANQLAIIDYKTGRTPNQNDVDIGEDVQLASYSLLQPDSVMVSYVSLDENNQRVKAAAKLCDEQLNDVREQSLQRLEDMIEKIKNQHALPAWGDKKVCSVCRYNGICRRAFIES